MNTKQNNKPTMKDLSDAALIDILLTVDGQGKQTKTLALGELLKRAEDEGYDGGYKDGWNECEECNGGSE